MRDLLVLKESHNGKRHELDKDDYFERPEIEAHGHELFVRWVENAGSNGPKKRTWINTHIITKNTNNIPQMIE